MSASLRALLAGGIDYAGMFPPAKLSLEVAFRNYLEYRKSPDAWMLGRFICPAQKLGEVTNLLQECPIGQPVAISMLGEVPSQQEIQWPVSNYVKLIRAFNDRHTNSALIEAMEI